MKEKQIILIRSILFALILLSFIGFENVSAIRLYKILLYSLLLLAMPYVRLAIYKDKRVFLIVIDIILVLLLSLSSRYVINYYIYALYMLLIIEVGSIYKLKESKYVISLVIMATFYNYMVLYSYRRNWGTISEIFFIFLINAVIVLGLVLFKLQREEKMKQNELYMKLDKSHNELLNANEALERLTSIEIKNTIARDIHDTFGHDMMALIMEIEMADILLESDKDKAKEMLERAKLSARSGMKTIRTVVETLRNDLDSPVTETIDEMIVRFSEKIDIAVNTSIDVSVYNRSKKIHDLLYQIVKECLTNSLRHGNASAIDIEIITIGHKVNFVVSDNGQIEEAIVEGYGLTGMRERVAKYNGALEIKSEGGFTVMGYIEVSDD